MFTSMSSQFFRALIPLCATALLCGCADYEPDDEEEATINTVLQSVDSASRAVLINSADEIKETAVLNVLGGLPLAEVEASSGAVRGIVVHSATQGTTSLGSRLPLAGEEASSGAVRGIVINSATQGTTSRMALSNAEQELVTQVDKLLDASNRFSIFLKVSNLADSPWRTQRDQIADFMKKLGDEVAVLRSDLEDGKCKYEALSACQTRYRIWLNELVGTVQTFLKADLDLQGDGGEGLTLQKQLRALLTESAMRTAQRIVARDSVTTYDGAFRVENPALGSVLAAGKIKADGGLSLTRLAATSAGKPASASPNQGTGRLVAPKLWSTAATQRGAGTVNVIPQREEAASSSSPLIQVDIRPAGSCDEGGACSFTADARYFTCGTDTWAFCTPRSAQCTPAAEQGCHRGFLSSLFSSSFVLPTIHQQCKLWCSYAGQEQGGVTVTVTRSALQNMEENRAVVEPAPLVGPVKPVVNPVVNPSVVKHLYQVEV
ncbi:MAG: hypothetical protein IJS87_03335, partial [Rhodocyclaceae bacterium]|nr:hypothetical protein [Rhodocyclaceae bacterium]